MHLLVIISIIRRLGISSTSISVDIKQALSHLRKIINCHFFSLIFATMNVSHGSSCSTIWILCGMNKILLLDPYPTLTLSSENNWLAITVFATIGRRIVVDVATISTDFVKHTLLHAMYNSAASWWCLVTRLKLLKSLLVNYVQGMLRFCSFPLP